MSVKMLRGDNTNIVLVKFASATTVGTVIRNKDGTYRAFWVTWESKSYISLDDATRALQTEIMRQAHDVLQSAQVIGEQ
jgi:hypothetical protein